jgi:hypothetical protein
VEDDVSQAAHVLCVLAREDKKKEEDNVKGYLGQRRWAEGEGRDGPPGMRGKGREGDGLGRECPKKRGVLIYKPYEREIK